MATTYTSNGTFNVPSNAAGVLIRCYGEDGQDGSANGNSTSTQNGGKGGYAEGVLPVDGGETLYIRMLPGGSGGSASSYGQSANGGDGGDGASVREGGDTVSDTVIAAGGAGGGAAAAVYNYNYYDASTGGSGDGGGNATDGGGATASGEEESVSTSGGAGGGASGTNGTNGGSDSDGDSGLEEGAAAAGGGGGGGYDGGTGGGASALLETFWGNALGAGGGGAGGDGYVGGVVNTAMSTGTQTGGPSVEIEVQDDVDDLIATANTEDEVDLAWSDVTWNNGYRIYRAEASGSTTGDYTQIADVGADVTSYTDSGLEDGEEYFYRVEPYDSSNSGLSNEASAVAILPISAIDSIELADSTSLTLSWTKADDSTDGGWRIYRSDTDGDLGTQVFSTLDEAATEYTDSVPDDTATYYYTLRRFTGATNADSSQLAAGTPTAPDNITATAASASSLDVTWTDIGTDEDGYRVYLSRDGGTTYTQAGSDLAADTELETATGLLNGEEYTVTVAAFTGVVEARGTPDTATTDLPDEDQPVLGNGVEDEIAVDREAAVSNYGDVRIQIRETGTATWDAQAEGFYQFIGAYDTLTMEFVGLEDGEEYEVRARTETEHATGAWTDPVSIIAKFPGATGLEVVAVDGGSADLKWQDNADNEDGTIIWRRDELDPLDPQTSFGEWVAIGEVDATDGTGEVTYTDATLDSNHDYEYKVEPYTEHTSAESGTVVTTTDVVVADEGWFVVFEDKLGEKATLDGEQIVKYPTLEPEASAVGAWKIDIRADQRYRNWQRSETYIYYDGSIRFRGPFHTYRVNGGRGDADDRLEGYCVLDKLRHGGTAVSYQSTEGYLAFEDFINNETPFTANVTPPTNTVVDEDLLVQDAPDDADFTDLFADPAAEDPYSVSATETVNLQTCWTQEAEDGSGSAGSFFDDDFSGGEAVRLENEGDEKSWTFENEHDIPADEFSLFARFQSPDGPQIEWTLDGTTIRDPSGFSFPSIEHRDLMDSGAATDPGKISAGEHTITATVTSEGSSAFDLDTIAPAHNAPEFEYTLDNDVHEPGGYIDGPEHYATVRIPATGFDTTFNITRAALSVDVDDPNGAALLQVRNDGQTWAPTDGTEEDTASVDVDFSTLGSEVEGRIGLGGQGTRDTATPRTGYQPQKVTGWELSIWTNSIRVIDDQTYTGSYFEIAKSILDDSGLVMVPDYEEDSLIINAFAPGEVTKQIDWTVTGVPEPVDTTDGFANSITVFGPEDENGNRPSATAVSQTSVDEVGEIEGEPLFRPDATTSAERESIARSELAKKLANDAITGQLEIESQIVQPGYAYEVEAFAELDEDEDPVYVLQRAKFDWGTMSLDFEGRDTFVQALRSIETEVKTTKRAL